MPTVPCKATHNLFIPDGRTDPALSQKGPLAVATPGALAAYAHALKHHGRWPLRVPLEAAATLAEQGFPLQKSYADRLRQEAKAVSASPGCRALLVRPDGATLSEDDWLRQPDLAHTYRSIAQRGPAWFYEGEIADSEGNGSHCVYLHK